MSCNCKSPFQDYITPGIDSILVNTILAPETDYLWEITDQFGNQYLIPFTTNEDGQGSIDVSELPDGFLNAAMGEFTVRVKATPQACDYEQLTIAVKYDSIAVKCVPSNIPKSNLGCAVTFPIAQGLRTTSEIFNITEETGTITIADAVESIVVLVDNVGYEDVAFDPVTHTWTFTPNLPIGAVVRIIYNH